MSENVIQHSFAGGELSPALFARADLAKYHSGAALMRNFFVDYRQGASTRTGTRFVGPTSDQSGAPVRLIPFQVTATQGYVIELGNLYARFYKNGALIVGADIPTPYLSADLALLKFTQSVSVMTICHPSYAPANLVRVSDLVWTLTSISFTTSIGAPGLGPLSLVPDTRTPLDYSTAQNITFGLGITAIDANGQESLPSLSSNFINTQTRIERITSGITWAAVTGAVAYNIYKLSPSYGSVPGGTPYGLIGSCTGLGVAETNVPPNFSITPPIPQNPFAGSNNPGVVAYYNQRHTFGNSNLNPQTFWMSVPGAFTPTSTNMNISIPVQADDAITGTIVSSKLGPIKHFVPMPGGLVTFTSIGIWQISGGGGQNIAITPIDAQATAQSQVGSNDVPPIVINFDVLYVQSKGSIVRDLQYNFYANIYTGTDITVFASHLFFNFQILEWAYAEEPFKVIYCVRNDGTLLAFTFLKEQEIQGWTHYDTNGLFKSICVVTEGTVDATYVVVRRLLNGVATLCIERLMERTFTYGIEDSWNLDCALQNTLPTPAATLTASASSGSGVIFTASAAVFGSTVAGDVIRMGGGIATITNVGSTTVVTATITQAITATWNDPAKTPLPATSGNWSVTHPTTTYSGLSYLNGVTVTALADGVPVTGLVVSGGSITLPNPATKVLVGLPYTCQLQTMPLDTGEPTIQGKRKKVNALTLRLKDSRGLKTGRTFSTLIPIKETSPPILAPAIGLLTLDERVVMDPLWDVPGQICIQQDNPWPATVLGVIPEITIGDNAK